MDSCYRLSSQYSLEPTCSCGNSIGSTTFSSLVRLPWNYLFFFSHPLCRCKFTTELDVRKAIDPRQYVELPSFLFLTLSCCALLSFSGIGSVGAATWPLGRCPVFSSTRHSALTCLRNSLARIHHYFSSKPAAHVCEIIKVLVSEENRKAVCIWSRSCRGKHTLILRSYSA